MKILLVNPPQTGSKNSLMVIGLPLGLLYIAAVLEKNKKDVEIFDSITYENRLTAERSDDKTIHIGASWQRIEEEIRKRKPDIVGISNQFSSQVENAVRISRIAKKINKKIIRENNCFDIVVYGEGEITAYELVELNKKGKLDAENLSCVKGIIFKDENKIIVTKPREPIQDLDSLPLPARHLLPMDRYTPLPNQYRRKPVVNMIMIRGCPFSCSFCSASAVFSRKIRRPSPEKAVNEIKHVIEKYGAREIAFWDDMITVNEEWFNKFCNLITENKLDIVWSCYARVDSVTPKVLKKMKEAGCWNIFYGIEAGDQQLLDNINKGITLEQSRTAVKWAKKAGIEVRGSFMLLLPGETPELARKTIDFALELDPDYAQFCLTTPYPGTKLYEEISKYGRIDKNFNRYDIWEPVFLPFGYGSEEEAKKIQKEAFRKFYLRPKYILGRIKRINSLSELKRYISGFRFLSGFLKKDN